MKWTLEENLPGGTVMGLVRWRAERRPLLESRGSQLAVCAQEKDLAAPAALA